MKKNSTHVYLMRQCPWGKVVSEVYWNQPKPYKIGWAGDPYNRRDKLQTGNPGTLSLEEYWEGTKEDEDHIHRMLGKRLIRGEWFLLCPEEEKMLKLYCHFYIGEGSLNQDEDHYDFFRKVEIWFNDHYDVDHTSCKSDFNILHIRTPIREPIIHL